jgi:alkylated DNA nucleotide flippase Atl1
MPNIPEDELVRQQVLQRVREVPEGKVASYGIIGASCEPPISGYICGRILGHGDQGIPWWRIVAKDGSLPVAKRNPVIAQQQRELLEKEGVAFTSDGKVENGYFIGQGNLFTETET